MKRWDGTCVGLGMEGVLLLGREVECSTRLLISTQNRRVTFLSRAIACIMFPSSYAAAFLSPRLASVASIIASSHSLHSDPQIIHTRLASLNSYPKPSFSRHITTRFLCGVTHCR